MTAVDEWLGSEKTAQASPILDKTLRQPSNRVIVTEVEPDTNMPHSIQAERYLLGSILLGNDYLKQISISIDANDFYLDSHKKIVAAMEALYAAKHSIDMVTLCNQLGSDLPSVGGVAYLSDLSSGLPRRPVIDEYVRIVADKAIGRKLIEIGNKAIALAQEQSQSSLISLDEVERQFISLKEKSKLLWRRKAETPFFVGYKTFTQETPAEVDWTVDGLIQKQGNGLILGDSGASKSMLVAHLLLHMVAGIQWFGHSIPKRVKAGLVSREDAPGLTQNRLMRLINGGSEALNTWLSVVDLEEWLYLHTRTQRKTWSLQNEADIQDVIEAAKERSLDFLVIDVFRASWTGNENDTQETAKVLASANRISDEAGCQVCLVHHLSKSEKGTIWDRARGGGINGWKEWGIGISIENPEAAPRDRVRKVEFHTKADQAADSIYYQIDGFVDKLMLNECSAPAKPYTFRHNKKKAKAAQAGLDL